MAGLLMATNLQNCGFRRGKMVRWGLGEWNQEVLDSSSVGRGVGFPHKAIRILSVVFGLAQRLLEQLLIRQLSPSHNLGREKLATSQGATYRSPYTTLRLTEHCKKCPFICGLTKTQESRTQNRWTWLPQSLLPPLFNQTSTPNLPVLLCILNSDHLP